MSSCSRDSMTNVIMSPGHLSSNRDTQSAYRPHHSTETAVLKVLADILLALDSGNFVMLTLLDLSAAYDSVDQRCADMYPRIDILRISVILTDTDRIRIVISMFERIRIRILGHGYSTDMHYGAGTCSHMNWKLSSYRVSSYRRITKKISVVTGES